MIRNSMKKLLGLSAKHPYILLFAVYAASVTVHIVKILQTAVLPSIMTDEMLYFNLAGSLASGNGVTFRGQSISFPYIGYPLCIAPLFALPKSVNLFRAIIIFNSVCVNAVVFPVYAIGNELTGRKNASLAVAVMTTLLPELMLARHIMIESVSIPLIMLTLLVMLRAYKKPSAARQILSGLCVCVLFIFKPGYIAFGAAYCAVNLYTFIRKRDRKFLAATVLPALTMCAGTVLYLIAANRLLKSNPSVQALYAAQTAGMSLDHVIKSLQGVIAYMGYGLLALCLMPVAFTLKSAITDDDARGHFARLLLTALMFIIIGTCYIIFYDEFLQSNNVPTRIHTRYFGYLLPVFWLYLTTDTRESGRELRMSLVICCMTVLVCMIYNARITEVAKVQYVVDSPMLIAYLHTSGAGRLERLLMPICGGVLLILAVLTRCLGKRRAVTAAILTVSVCICALQTYSIYRADMYAMNRALDADAREVAETLDGSAVFVCDTDDLTEYNAMALDIHTRSKLLPITSARLAQQTEKGGRIERVTPNEMNRFLYTLADVTIDKPEYLVLNSKLTYQLLLSKDAANVGTTGNGMFSIYRLPPNGRWLHSGLFALNTNWVDKDSFFMLCDDGLLSNASVKLYLKVRAGISGASLTLTASGGQTQTFYPTSSTDMEWLTAEFSLDGDGEPLVIKLENANGNIYIDTYLVE